MKKYFYLILLFLILGCKSDIQLSMERGIQFYEWGKLEKAILEFKYIIHNLDENNISYDNILLLSRAHKNLAISYAKKTWYTDALKEANKAFQLAPTEDNKKIINLINNKINNTSK